MKLILKSYLPELKLNLLSVIHIGKYEWCLYTGIQQDQARTTGFPFSACFCCLHTDWLSTDFSSWSRFRNQALFHSYHAYRICQSHMLIKVESGPQKVPIHNIYPTPIPYTVTHNQHYTPLQSHTLYTVHTINTHQIIIYSLRRTINIYLGVLYEIKNEHQIPQMKYKICVQHWQYILHCYTI